MRTASRNGMRERPLRPRTSVGRWSLTARCSRNWLRCANPRGEERDMSQEKRLSTSDIAAADREPRETPADLGRDTPTRAVPRADEPPAPLFVNEDGRTHLRHE